MKLQCWRCKAYSDFNDGIGEDVLFHAYGWILWGEENGKQYASCPNCWTMDSNLFRNSSQQTVDNTKKIPHTHPMDIFFSLETSY